MKKAIRIISVLLCAALIAGLFAGCSKSADSSYSGGGNYYAASGTSSSPGYAKSEFAYDAPMEPEADYGGVDGEALLSSVTTAQQPSDFSEKIIYSATAEIETIDFDKSVQDVYDMLSGYGGFVESSYVSGTNYSTAYYGYASYRSARFVVRVPVEAYKSFTEHLNNLGNITGIYTSADNITTQYYDVQSRLTAYQTEEKTLLNMLSKAETVSDMLEIERELSEVRYNIESLQSTLKNWDNKVSYSTVTIEISEVKELSDPVEIQRTFGEEVAAGFMRSLRSVGRFFRNLARDIIIDLPVFVTIAVVIALAVFVIRLLIGDKEKRAARKAKRQEKKNARLLKKYGAAAVAQPQNREGNGNE